MAPGLVLMVRLLSCVKPASHQLLPFVEVLILERSSQIVLCVFLEEERGPRPKAALSSLDGSSLVSASPPFSD